MKRILFLMSNPSPGVNGVCIQKIIDTLDPKEYDITCICYDNKLYTADTPNVKIYKVSRGLFHTLKYKMNKRNMPAVRIIDFLLKIRQIPFLLTWPLVDPVFTRRVFHLAEKLYRQSPFDSVVAVHHPPSSLYVASKLKKQYPKIKYVAYFLDALSGGHSFNTKYISKDWIFKKKLKAEERVLANADIAVVMESSRKHHEKYNANKPFYGKLRFLNIPLLDKPDSSAILETPYLETTKINLLFCGAAYYPYRNIPYFISVLGNAGLPDTVFTIIGSTNREDKLTGDNVVFIPTKPHSEIVRAMKSADILINFGVRTPSAISGKIFEYMSYGKPIISTYSIDDEACIPYLKNYPLALLLDERETDLESQGKRVRQFIEDTKGKRVEFDTVKEMFKNNLPETFVKEVLES
jgi:glycosyltransferase involved in cell wall biosynthesis